MQEPQITTPKSVLPKIAKELEKDSSELHNDLLTWVIENHELRWSGMKRAKENYPTQKRKFC